MNQDTLMEHEGETRFEYLKEKLKTKDKYYFYDSEQDFEILVKEVMKNRKEIIHYPFNKDGKSKYNFKKIIYRNMPNPLPAGIIKSPYYGYGFTKEVNPYIYKLQDEFKKLETIIVDYQGETKIIDDTIIQLSYNDIKKARNLIVPMLNKQKIEKNNLVVGILNDTFPGLVEEKQEEYTTGELASFIASKNITAENLSVADLKSITDLISKLNINHLFVKEKRLITTKEKIEKIYLEDIVDKYKELMSQKTETTGLEDKWQEFFSENILYFNMGYVEKFEKERIQGDKTLNIPDYILLNTYGYLDVFEIKTHLTKLLSHDKGRDNFYWSSEATKAISQAENYIDSMIEQSKTLIVNIRDKYKINVDVIRPKVYIIASSWDNIAGRGTSEKFDSGKFKKLKNDFRRLNNALKNIEFVLYDELLNVFENTISRISKCD